MKVPGRDRTGPDPDGSLGNHLHEFKSRSKQRNSSVCPFETLFVISKSLFPLFIENIPTRKLSFYQAHTEISFILVNLSVQLALFCNSVPIDRFSCHY